MCGVDKTHIFYYEGVMNSIKCLKEIEDKLKSIPSFKEDAITIMEMALNINKSYILAGVEINEKELETINSFVARRLDGEPIQKLKGYTEFLNLKILFNENTLTPRMETEILADMVIKYINSKKDKLRVLDLCSGSGCIGLGIIKNTDAEVVLSDISEFAINHIKENAKLNYIDVNVVKSDMFKNISGNFDIIISNPPYLKTEELASLEKEVDLYDPKLALDGGIDGLKFYKEIANNLDKFLKPNGDLFLEIHYALGEATKEIFKSYFERVEIKKDYGNLDRFICCYNRKERIC